MCGVTRLDPGHRVLLTSLLLTAAGQGPTPPPVWDPDTRELTAAAETVRALQTRCLGSRPSISRPYNGFGFSLEGSSRGISTTPRLVDSCQGQPRWACTKAHSLSPPAPHGQHLSFLGASRTCNDGHRQKEARGSRRDVTLRGDL